MPHASENVMNFWKPARMPKEETMRGQFVLRSALILFVIGIFFAATSHAQASTQSTTDTTTIDTTQTTTQPTTQTTTQPTTSSQNCSAPCPTPLPSTSTGGGTSAELYVNAGGIWPTRMDNFDNNKIKAQGIYGLKGGFIFASGVQLEFSGAYLNDFALRHGPNFFNVNPDGTIGTASVYAILYDINGAYNFGNRRVLGAKFDPYVVAGVGGLSAQVKDGNSALLQGGGLALNANGQLIPNPAPTRFIHSGDTFFTVNYGGGIKASNLWGPIGFRADVRGRTIPNFFHSTPTWPEITGGLLISFGQQ
jgi:hypothetical protein